MHARMTDQAEQTPCIKPYKVPVVPLPSMHPDPQSVPWDSHLSEGYRMWAARRQPRVIFAGTLQALAGQSCMHTLRTTGYEYRLPCHHAYEWLETFGDE